MIAYLSLEHFFSVSFLPGSTEVIFEFRLITVQCTSGIAFSNKYKTRLTSAFIYILFAILNLTVDFFE